MRGSHGSSPESRRRGGAGGTAWGGGMGWRCKGEGSRVAAGLCASVHCCSLLLAERRKKETGRRKREEKKTKEKKRKKYGKFSKLGKFLKNKKNYEVSQKLFLYKKSCMSSYK
jgi:hypothetical protein